MNKLPRLLIAAPQSGSGKTTIVSGLLAALKRRGFSVQPFKVGPDYIDAGYHEAASGRRCHSLDTWLTGAEAMKSIFAGNAEKAGISVIEGVMGFYDGGRGGISSTAEIAKLLKTPVVLVIDVRSMGESAAALVRGFRDYDGATDIRGVILNRLGSESHRQIICEAMEKIGMPVLGSVFRDERLSLPSRHLGLLPRSENSHTGITDIIRDAAVKSLDLEELVRIAESSPELAVKQSKKKIKNKR